MHREVRFRAACLLVLFVATACGAPATLTEATLRNGTYPSHEDPSGFVTLKDGRFEDPGQHLTVVMDDAFALGDLDGDGTDDAVVFLAVNTGGSGTFVESAVVFAGDDAPTVIRGSRLGDRTRIDAVRIDNGRIIVALTTHAESDAMCCPTLEVEKRYQVAGKVVDEIETGLPPVAASPSELPIETTPGRAVSGVCGEPVEGEGNAFLKDARVDGEVLEVVLIEGSTEALTAQLWDAFESASELGFGLCVGGTYVPGEALIEITEAHAVPHP